MSEMVNHTNSHSIQQKPNLVANRSLLQVPLLGLVKLILQVLLDNFAVLAV